MVRYKYTPEALAAAAAVARSVTEVMRLLGVRVSGGSHAHISRQLKRFGIDTSHFTGALNGAGRRERRMTSAQLLVRLPEGSRRIPGSRLKWALGTIGVPEECEECGIGPRWQGRPLALHVDHVNGDFLDNRPPNLRLLCPNCHCQTGTYAGRNRRLRAGSREVKAAPRSAGQRRVRSGSQAHLREEQLVELFDRVDAKELTITEVARDLGCSRAHLYQVRERLREAGLVAPRPAVQPPSVRRELVLSQALAHPELGPKPLARLLRELPGGCHVSHGTISNILREEGLNTAAARRSRLSDAGGSGGIGRRAGLRNLCP